MVYVLAHDRDVPYLKENSKSIRFWILLTTKIPYQYNRAQTIYCGRCNLILLYSLFKNKLTIKQQQQQNGCI